MKKLLFVLLVFSVMSCQKEPLYVEPVKPTDVTIVTGLSTVSVTKNGFYSKENVYYSASWTLYNVGDNIKLSFYWDVMAPKGSYNSKPVKIYIDGEYLKTIFVPRNTITNYTYIKEK